MRAFVWIGSQGEREASFRLPLATTALLQFKGDVRESGSWIGRIAPPIMINFMTNMSGFEHKRLASPRMATVPHCLPGGDFAR
jgi:hypothetical protein